MARPSHGKAVRAWFIELLKTHLQSELDIVTTDAGETSLSAPVDNQYSNSPMFPFGCASNRIAVFLRRTVTPKQPVQCPILTHQVTVRAWVVPPNSCLDELEDARESYGQAIANVISQRWSDDANPAAIQSVSASIEHDTGRRAEGIGPLGARQQSQSALSNTAMDVIDVRFTVEQHGVHY